MSDLWCDVTTDVTQGCVMSSLLLNAYKDTPDEIQISGNRKIARDVMVYADDTASWSANKLGVARGTLLLQ